MNFIIIPMKSLKIAKLRLAPILNSEQRRELCINMFKDVIEATSSTQTINNVVTVSSDPIILEIGRQYGDIISESQKTEINLSINLAIKFAINKNADSVLILPGDIPLITSKDIDQLFDFENKPPTVIISPSSNVNGTNLLFLSPPNIIKIEYGENSFQKHLKKAGNIKDLNLIVYHSHNIGLDIDLPSDLFIFLSSPSQTHAFQYLNKLELKISS